MKTLLIVMLILSRFPLSGFQFLLLICLIEIETGIFIGDFYWSIMIFFYLLFRYTWYSTLRKGISYDNRPV